MRERKKLDKYSVDMIRILGIVLRRNLQRVKRVNPEFE